MIRISTWANGSNWRFKIIIIKKKKKKKKGKAPELIISNSNKF